MHSASGSQPAQTHIFLIIQAVLPGAFISPSSLTLPLFAEYKSVSLQGFEPITLFHFLFFFLHCYYSICYFD